MWEDAAMFIVLILVCSINLAPADCQIDTAAAVMNGPDVPNEIMCGLHGQAYIANTAFISERDDRYVKIQCTRSPIEQGVGASR
jgi:hypothetical protein